MALPSDAHPKQAETFRGRSWHIHNARLEMHGSRYAKDLDLWVDANQADRLLIAIFGRSIDLRDVEGLDPGGNR